MAAGLAAGPVQTHTPAGQWLKSQLYEQRPMKLLEMPSAVVPPVQAEEGGTTVDYGGVVAVPAFVAADVIVVEAVEKDTPGMEKGGSEVAVGTDGPVQLPI